MAPQRHIIFGHAISPQERTRPGTGKTAGDGRFTDAALGGGESYNHEVSLFGLSARNDGKTALRQFVVLS